MACESVEAPSDIAIETEPVSPAIRFAAGYGRRGPAIDRLNVELGEILQNDMDGAGVQLNRQGRVARGHYAARIGVHFSYLCKVCRSTLDEWDARLREINGGLSPAAREFMELVRADARTPGGVAARGERIFLKVYAERMGLAPTLISRVMGEHLSRFEGELLEAGILKVKPPKQRPRLRDPNRGAAQASQLQSRLELDDQSPSGIRLNQRGRVDEQHYAAELGLGKFSPEASQVRNFWNDRIAERNNGLSLIGRRFVALIEAEKVSETGLVGTETGLIDLAHYARELGVSSAGIRAALGSRLVLLNQTLRQEGYLRKRLEKQLLAEVRVDILAGRGPKLGRGGKLHREHYAERLGVDAAQLGRVCRTILGTLDSEHGASSHAEVRIDEMRRWLEQQYDQRTLPVREGKIDRRLFQHEFGFKGGTFMVRYPKIRALFDEFDARAVAENYCPAALDASLQRLRHALADMPELNKDRLSISRPALEKTLGISVSRLSRSPFIEEIRLYEGKITHRAKQCLIDPFLADRVFVFSDLADKWGRGFLTKVGVQFKKAFGHTKDKSHLKSRYLAFRSLLLWVGDANHPACGAVVSSAVNNQPIGQFEWEQAVFAYREHVVSELKQKVRSKLQADATIGSIRRILDQMDPVLPNLKTELAGIKHARAFVAHRGSLAEATATAITPAGAKYIEFANSMLRQAADRFKVEIENDEAVNFTSVLAAEMERFNDLPSDLGHAVLVVLNRRLTAIHDAASLVIDRARTDLEQGANLLAQARIDADEFYQEYVWRRSRNQPRKELLRQWFPDPASFMGDAAEDARNSALANLFALATDKFDGFLPGLSSARALADFGQFFQKRYTELGTKESLGRFLNPDRNAAGAALTLYLVESGANVSVGRTLELDCIEVASQPGYKLITGHKSRAKGKPIYAELPAEASSIRALEWYAAQSARIRAKASQEEARYLFVHHVGERWQLVTPHWYTSWFKSFASAIPALDQVDVAPSMMRPSVLLKAALENDGRLQVGRAIGQHSEAVTRGYQEKLPIRLLRDQHMRRFQRHFETRVLQNVANVARNLGISADEFEQRIDQLQATGLGTFCVDPLARPGLEGEQCKSVDCWRDCPQLLIVANVEAIALLQIWRTSLEDARGAWERDHPERWGEVWLPWLCLTEVVEKRMSRGTLLTTWRQAQDRAAEIVSDPNFIAPRPF